jgi:TetR/AcrR family transcriptional regulator, transcriptional repressor for nem operon
MSQRAEQKAESRSAILRAAAALLREKGISGMSVERAMKGAGLTVGAFYGHFAGKDELLEDSFSLALAEIGESIDKTTSGRTGQAALREVIAYYLSEGHRDRAKKGCPMPAVSASATVAPQSPAERRLPRLVARGLETFAAHLERIGAGRLTSERALALAVLLVGGQIIARATRGSPMSSQVLLACREAAQALLPNDRS